MQNNSQSNKMIKKIVIANRGEIALRILRACKNLGIQTVAVYSTADKNLPHISFANEAICIGEPHPTKSYLNQAAILGAAEITHANAIHPGYGFLSENASFATQVEKEGFIFIGPRPENIEQMGDKISAINIMQKLGVPCVPGSRSILKTDVEKIKETANTIGYPLIIKAANGGGGKGMRVVLSEDTLLESIDIVRAESLAAFKSDAIYLEKYLQHPRHIEIQIIADGKGNVVHLGERDCSIQRRHQKLLEEAPGIGISEEQRALLGEICCQACRGIGYRGLGTLEFLYENNEFYFIEMNTRIQVEHGITEMITGIDMVKEQLKIADGRKLSFNQSDVKIKGHAIQCRINAEHPYVFTPSPGTINTLHFPGGLGIRIESHIYQNYVVPPFYDSLIAKIITYDEDRKTALSKMRHALDETKIEGIETNLALHKRLLTDDTFAKGSVTIHYLEEWLKNLDNPKP